MNPNMLFHSAAFKTTEKTPKLVPLTICPNKSSLGSWWYWSTKWNNSSAIIFWFYPSPTLTTFLVSRDIRRTFCYPCTVFTWGAALGDSNWNSDILKYETDLVSRSITAFYFSLSLIHNSKAMQYFAFIKLTCIFNLPNELPPQDLETFLNSNYNFLPLVTHSSTATAQYKWWQSAHTEIKGYLSAIFSYFLFPNQMCPWASLNWA